MPNCVWVWDMQRVGLQAVLEQASAVRCFLWDPRRPRLALCTGNNKLYLWSPAGCVSVRVPVEGKESRSHTHTHTHSTCGHLRGVCPSGYLWKVRSHAHTHTHTLYMWSLVGCVSVSLPVVGESCSLAHTHQTCQPARILCTNHAILSQNTQVRNAS